jgi:hypothetical protein
MDRLDMFRRFHAGNGELGSGTGGFPYVAAVDRFKQMTQNEFDSLLARWAAEDADIAKRLAEKGRDSAEQRG